MSDWLEHRGQLADRLKAAAEAVLKFEGEPEFFILDEDGGGAASIPGWAVDVTRSPEEDEPASDTPDEEYDGED